jgi:tRNA nucleotidyltransferase (CCA-adding enzyme)
LSQPPAIPAPPSLASARFPDEILFVLRTLRRAGYAAYLVGGSIRDRLLGKEAKDHDVATSARAEVVAKLFRRVIPTGIKHGTVTVLIGDSAIEVTTFRGEGEYRDGRRPDSVFFIEDIVEDLARRDFTINAMAFDPETKTLIDPFGGGEDLARRLVRCVRDPLKRFSEDGLRPLRAVRFASVLDFEIETATREAIPKTIETFAKVAQERVREELTRLLVGGHPARGVALLRETGLLARILPEVAALDGIEEQGRDAFELTLARVDRAPVELELRLAALLHDIELGPAPAKLPKRLSRVEAVLDRLRYPLKVIEQVDLLVKHRGFALSRYADDAELRRGLAAVGRNLVAPLIALGRCQASALGDEALLRGIDELEQRVAEVLAKNPALAPGELAIDGRRIMDLLGLPRGPQVGHAMRYLMERVLDDPDLNTAESLERLLKGWFTSQA